MSRVTIRRALRRMEPWVLEAASAEGALARAEAGAAGAGDAALLQERVAALAAGQREDGSWSGQLGATGRALLELGELVAALDGASAPLLPERHAAAAPALGWLQARRGAAGRFGEGCEPDWHARGLCHHFLDGFHAPGPEEPELSSEALIVDSALALRGALRWGDAGPMVEQHLDGLRRIVSAWAWPDGGPGLRARCGVASLGVLLEDCSTSESVRAAAEGIACLVRTQRADGTWSGVELYDVLDVLLFGVARGFRVDEVDAALARAAELLALARADRGAWDVGAGPRQPLTAWRVLRHIVACHEGVESTSA